MNDINNILSKEFLFFSFIGNTLYEYLIATLLFVILLIVFKIFREVILMKLEKFAEKTKTDLDETFILIVRKLRPPFYTFLAFYLSIRLIELNDFIFKILTSILIIWVIYQVVIAISILVDYTVGKYLIKEKNEGTKGAINLFGKISKGIIWAVAVMFTLSNLGVNINSLIAGLGIGGIAVALALQNVLGDLFSSFAIYFDRPFVPGDLIIVGSDMGVVERIGIKTTRLRALQGEEITISNQELTSARIHNFKKMQERRISFAFGVTYETKTKVLRKIPEIVKNIIDEIDLTRFDRAHFKAFSESSLDFEIVYYTKSSDYNTHMDIHQKILLEIKEKLEKEDISMAYPTRTVYLKNLE